MVIGWRKWVSLYSFDGMGTSFTIFTMHRNALGAGTIYNINNIVSPGALYFDACAHGPDFLSTNPDCPRNSNALRAIEHNITQWLGQSIPFDFGSDSMPAPIIAQNTNVFAMAGKHSPSTPPTGANMSCNKLFEVVVQRVPSNVKAGGSVKVRDSGS